MNNRKVTQNSQRQNHKGRRDLSPSNKSKEKNDSRRNKSDHERYRSETDLSKIDEDKEKDKKTKEKGNLNKKNRNRSPRRPRDSYSDRKYTTQKREIKLKVEAKDKLKEKKTNDVSGILACLMKYIKE